MAKTPSEIARDIFDSAQRGLRVAGTIAQSAVAVTTHDTNDLTEGAAALGLYIGVSGDVKVDMAGTGTVTFKAAPVGFLPVNATRVYATGTTATDILALS